MFHNEPVFINKKEIDNKAKKKLEYELPEGNRIFTRKAQFQYGWDWGPKLNTSGIWRPVTLVAWNDFKIADIYVQLVKDLQIYNLQENYHSFFIS